ncbi:MAG: hypothetical protein OXR66_05960 [Candidatus Woesearchaeota archaeon]|nr:hypothetical protein [Candidatus Woesearchaeota archaeon]
MTHYVCNGGCNGKSETPGSCQAEDCADHAKQLVHCDCVDDMHGREE